MGAAFAQLIRLIAPSLTPAEENWSASSS
jgi:hypothetical protein